MMNLSSITKNRMIFSVAAGLMLLLQSCNTGSHEPLTIALSKGSPVESYQNYYTWIHHFDPNAVVLDMYSYSVDSALILFGDCDGLLITGGTDIDPAIYGKPWDTARCWTIDHKRDSLEMALFHAARRDGKPILGICRGEQMINVVLGGSLIVDIPADFDTTVKHQCDDHLSCFHKVTVESHTMLHEISGIYAGEVNSNHHQGVEVLARELKAVSYASDGLIEAVEWAYTEGNPFLLGVQWHPERMEYDHPLSGPVAERFLEEARAYARKQDEIKRPD